MKSYQERRQTTPTMRCYYCEFVNLESQRIAYAFNCKLEKLLEFIWPSSPKVICRNSNKSQRSNTCLDSPMWILCLHRGVPRGAGSLSTTSFTSLYWSLPLQRQHSLHKSFTNTYRNSKCSEMTLHSIPFSHRMSQPISVDLTRNNQSSQRGRGESFFSL